MFVVIGTFLHLANPEGPSCPVQAVSMINDPGWKKLHQIGFKDPSGQQWSLTHRQENIQNLVYDNAISIKLARDVNKKQMYTGAYIRSAEFENGGTYQVKVQYRNFCEIKGKISCQIHVHHFETNSHIKIIKRNNKQ